MGSRSSMSAWTVCASCASCAASACCCCNDDDDGDDYDIVSQQIEDHHDKITVNETNREEWRDHLFIKARQRTESKKLGAGK